MITKSQLNRHFMSYSGIKWIKWKLLPKGLYCMNYHRIGEPTTTKYDPSLYSCNAENFNQHLEFYKKKVPKD